MMKAAAIIQVRLGSSRLPGKVLMPLRGGRPLLGVILDRLRSCRTLDAILVATTERAEDNALESFCRKEKVPCFRGSVDDVLGRMIAAAESAGAEVVVRVTGDAPWIDPATIDREVERLRAGGADYAHVDPSQAVALEGFETVSLEALRRVDRLPGLPTRHREHVTTYIRENLGEFKVETLEAEPVLLRRGVKLSIDTPADLRFHAEAYRRLGGVSPDLRDLMRLLDTDAQLASQAPHPVRKAPGDSSRRVLLCVEAGADLGWGHLVRQRSLGRRLNELHACGVLYAVRGTDRAERCLREERLPVHRLPEDAAACHAELVRLAREYEAQVAVFDVQTPVPAALVRSLQAAGSRVALVDSTGDGRLEADLVVDPSLHGNPDSALRPRSGEHCEGGEFVILNDRVASHRPRPADQILERGRPPRLLVTMGGSDPHGMTLLAARALVDPPADVAVEILVGPDFQRRQELVDLLAGNRDGARLIEAPDDPAEAYLRADLALACFGVTAYELAYLGVPALLLSHSRANAEAAAALSRHGFSFDLGYFEDTDPRSVRAAVCDLLSKPERPRAMARAGCERIDGRGAERVAGKILVLPIHV